MWNQLFSSHWKYFPGVKRSDFLSSVFLCLFLLCSSLHASQIVQLAPKIERKFPESGIALREEAMRLANDLAARYPQMPDAIEVKARIHLLLGETTEAKTAWQRALVLSPNYAYANHGLGKVALLDSEYDLAVEQLLIATKAQPGLAEPVHELADAYMKLGEVPEAVAVLRPFAAANGNSTETFLLLGQAYLLQQEYELAQDAFEKTLELQPDVIQAQEGLGKVLMRLGKRDEARKILEEQKIVRAALDKGNQSAEEVFANECRDYANRYVQAARIYIAGEQASIAVDVLEKAVILDSKNTDAWSLLLKNYQSLGQLSKAVERGQAMCEANADIPGCHYTYALLEAQSGNLQQAQVSLEKVIALSPETANGYGALARLLIQGRKSLARTISLADKAVQLRGNAADYELLAQTYAVNSKFDLAYDALKTALQLAPQNQAYMQAMKQLQAFRAQSKE